MEQSAYETNELRCVCVARRILSWDTELCLSRPDEDKTNHQHHHQKILGANCICSENKTRMSNASVLQSFKGIILVAIKIDLHLMMSCRCQIDRVEKMKRNSTMWCPGLHNHLQENLKQYSACLWRWQTPYRFSWRKGQFCAYSPCSKGKWSCWVDCWNPLCTHSDTRRLTYSHSCPLHSRNTSKLSERIERDEKSNAVLSAEQ